MINTIIRGNCIEAMAMMPPASVDLTRIAWLVADSKSRSAFSATTITGKFVPIRIEKAEAQTGP